MLEQRIEAWIAEHQKELLADIEMLVKIPSVSVENGGQRVFGDDCAKALETMLALGQLYGFQVHNADYYCGVMTYGEHEKSIGLWGHLDVVPAGNDWLYPPFDCTQKDGFLIGRGVQDNKGPVVVALYAMRCIRDLGLPLQHNLQQIVGCAEETGMADVMYYVDHYEIPAFNLITDCGFPVCYGEKGILESDIGSAPLSDQLVSFQSGTVSNIVPDFAQMVIKNNEWLQSRLCQLPSEIVVAQTKSLVTLTTRGISAHAAFPSGSENAAAKLACAVQKANLFQGSDKDILEAVGKICGSTDGSALDIACEDALSGGLTCVGGVIKTIDHRLVVSLNIRYPISADAKQLESLLVKGAVQSGFTVQTLHNSAPNYFDPLSPYVQSLTNTYNEVMGTKQPPFVMGGGTYARKIPNAVAFGPGLPVDASKLGLPEGHGNCHAPDELQSIENLYTALKIYVLSLVALDATMGQHESEE